jgi:hypothetical protein
MGRDGGLALALALSRGSTGYLLRTVYDLSTAQRQTADGNATPQLVLRWNAKKGSNVSCLRTPVRKYGVAQAVGSGGNFSSRLTDAQLGVPPGHFTDAPRLGQPPKRQTIPSLLLTGGGTGIPGVCNAL